MFRGEFALLDNSLTPEFMVAAEAGEGLKGHAMTWGLRWLLNHEATLATVAPAYADMCTLAALPKAQWSTALPERADGCRWSEAMFNPFGCVLVDIAVPSWADYLLRDRDGEGQLRLLALADWLARQPDPAAAFAERPASFREFEHAVRFENGELSIDLLKPRDAKTPQWRIPLPGSRLPPAPVDQDGGTGSST